MKVHLYHESSGPSLDHGLEQRLKRLDPNFRITFSSYAIDPQTGYPILDALTSQPIPEPAQHLWHKTSEGWRHVDVFLMANGGFGHLNCKLLELNQRTVESYKPAQLFQILEDKKHVKQELAKRNHLGYRQDRAKANAKRIGDLVFNGKSGYRQAKVSSYPGQVHHATPDQVLEDAAQDGWEL